MKPLLTNGVIPIRRFPIIRGLIKREPDQTCPIVSEWGIGGEGMATALRSSRLNKACPDHLISLIDLYLFNETI